MTPRAANSAARARCQCCGHDGHLGADLIEEARRDGHSAILCRDSGACWIRWNATHMPELSDCPYHTHAEGQR